MHKTPLFIATSLLILCSHVGAKQEDNKFILYVTNQSLIIKNVQLEIKINGTKICDQDFHFETGHTYKQFYPKLKKGNNLIEVTSKNPNCENFKKEFIFTNENYGNQGNDPTHSQVAKDHPEHHLNKLAGELAVAAVYEIGTIMKGIWDDNPRYSINNIEDKINNKYFKHPSDTDWMRDLVEKWIEKRQGSNHV